MDIYNYDRLTGELLSTSEAKPDPLDEGKWLIPANATTDVPPVAAENQVAVYKDGGWTLDADFRSLPAWNTVSAEPVEIVSIGPLPGGVTLSGPGSIPFPVWDGSGWINDDESELAQALSVKLEELRTEKNSRVDSAVGTGDSRRKDKLIARGVKLLRRESKGNATPEEIAELDQMEALDDHLDTLESEYDTAEQWLEDPARTIAEIQAYDVAVDPVWSTLS